MSTRKKEPVCRDLWIFLGIALVVLGVTHLYEQHKMTKLITYHIEMLDPRFQVSEREFSRSIRQAAALWEQAAGCRLFSEQSGGDIAVRLVYDYRQAACDKRKALNETLAVVRGSYEAEQDRLLRLQAGYEAKRTVLLQDIKDYQARLSAYEMQNRPLFHMAGPPQHLRVMREELAASSRDLRRRQDELNTASDQLTATFSRLNAMAARINSTSLAYSITGQQLGNEFCAGRYIRSGGLQSITIYQFDNRDKLLCALAHELGHALGLDHTGSPHSVMYYHNNALARRLSPEDVAALRALPRFQ